MRRAFACLAAAAACFTAATAAAPAVADDAAAVRAPLPIQPDGQRAPSVVGPFVAGDAAVFGVGAGLGEPARTWAAPDGGGPLRELPGPATLVGGGAAGVLARANMVIAGGGSRYDSAYVARESLYAGAVGAPPRPLTTCVGPAAAEGARVAYLTGPACDTVTVRDVPTGVEIAHFPLGLPSTEYGDLALRLAGDRVAWRRSGDLRVGDATTGTVRVEAWPQDALGAGWALGADGRLAFALTPSFRPWQVVLREPGGAAGSERALTTLTRYAGSGFAFLLGFQGPDVVLDRGDWQAGRMDERLVVLPADGAPPRTLVHGVRAWADGALLGTDFDGGRIAWMVRDCDEVVARSAAIADLPAAGIDLTAAPPRCARPVLERTTMAVDGRGRGTIAFRCPAACSGAAVLHGVERWPDGEGRDRAVAARPAFARAGAGRGRIAVRLRARERAWLTATHGPKVRGVRRLQVTLAGTTGGRPTSARTEVRVVARRATAKRR